VKREEGGTHYFKLHSGCGSMLHGNDSFFSLFISITSYCSLAGKGRGTWVVLFRREITVHADIVRHTSFPMLARVPFQELIPGPRFDSPAHPPAPPPSVAFASSLNAKVAGSGGGWVGT